MKFDRIAAAALSAALFVGPAFAKELPSLAPDSSPPKIQVVPPPPLPPPPYPTHTKPPCPTVLFGQIKIDKNTAVSIVPAPGERVVASDMSFQSPYSFQMIGGGLLLSIGKAGSLLSLGRTAAADAPDPQTLAVITEDSAGRSTFHSLNVSGAASTKDVTPAVMLPSCPLAGVPDKQAE